MKFHVPIKLPSLANARMHWRALARLKRSQRKATRYCMVARINSGQPVPPPPLLVTITRVGSRLLDDDNLAHACKYVRDEVAAVVGVDDGSPLYTWRYEQRAVRGGPYGVDVEVVGSGDPNDRSAATSLGRGARL